MEIRVLKRRDLEVLLEMKQVICGVEEAYRTKAQGNVAAWPLVEHHFDGNAVMDIRSGGVFGDVNVHGAKMLNNFPGNAERNLPVFTGVLMVFDSNTGIPMGILDASYVTCMRTGAAGAISVRALSRKDTATLLLVGAGRQAFYQVGAVLSAMPGITRVLVVDPLSVEFAQKFAESMPERLNAELHIDAEKVSFEAMESLEEAVGKADAIITITRAMKPLIRREWVRPGTHLTCIGADMAGKEEVDPELFRGSRVFCDDIAQCCRVGESEIPFKMGIIREEDFCGEIGQVLTGEVPGRLSDEDITIFDATGLAALDLVTAKVALESAVQAGIGQIAEL